MATELVTDIEQFRKEDIELPPLKEEKSSGSVPVKFLASSFWYMHGTKNGKRRGQMKIQGPVVKSAVRESKFSGEDGGSSSYGNVGYVAPIALDGPEGEAIRALLDAARDIGVAAVLAYIQMNPGTKLKNDFPDMERGRERIEIYPTKDAGTIAYKYFKLKEFDGRITTKLYFPKREVDGTISLQPFPIDKLLRGTVTMIPTFWFKRIYIGKQHSVQVFLDSAIITDFTESTVSAAQLSAAQRVLSLQPDIAARMAKLVNTDSTEPAPSWGDSAAPAAEVPDTEAMIRAALQKSGLDSEPAKEARPSSPEPKPEARTRRRRADSESD